MSYVKHISRKEEEIWSRAGGCRPKPQFRSQWEEQAPAGSSCKYHCVMSSIWVFVWIMITSADHALWNNAKGTAHTEKGKSTGCYIFKTKTISVSYLAELFFWIFVKKCYK